MLTPEALIERRKGIGASEAKKIVSGEWYPLWLDKTGRAEPKAILSPWDQAVRHVMEPIILDHYEVAMLSPITRRGEALICPTNPILRCTLDGFDVAHDKAVDAKCLNVFVPDAREWCVGMYSSQMQHQMICTGAKHGSLYVSVGMKEPFEIPFDFDEFWCAEYEERCREFWHYVETNTPPPDAPTALAEPKRPVEEMRMVDMQGNNAWAAGAATWLDNRLSAKAFDEATKALKGMVEADVREATGYGVKATRSKAGAVSIKETKK